MDNLHLHFNSPCAACKFLRRKCLPECVFAPYFPADQPQKFAFVHRVYGASNVAKMLNDVSHDQREDAVNSLAYEAEARLRDPVYGCVGFISILQRRLKQLQTDIFVAKNQLSTYLGPQAMAPILQPHMAASSSSSVNELQLQHAAGIPMQSAQPLMVDPNQSSTQQFPVVAMGSRDDQPPQMFLVSQAVDMLNNNNNNNIPAGFVDTYGYNPMTMTTVPSAPLSSSFQGINYQIQPQQSEGHISNLRIPHQLQQQFFVQTQAAMVEQQTQQPPMSLLIQDAPETRMGLHLNIPR